MLLYAAFIKPLFHSDSRQFLWGEKKHNKKQSGTNLELPDNWIFFTPSHQRWKKERTGSSYHVLLKMNFVKAWGEVRVMTGPMCLLHTTVSLCSTRVRVTLGHMRSCESVPKMIIIHCMKRALNYRSLEVSVSKKLYKQTDLWIPIAITEIMSNYSIIIHPVSVWTVG